MCTDFILRFYPQIIFSDYIQRFYSQIIFIDLIIRLYSQIIFTDFIIRWYPQILFSDYIHRFHPRIISTDFILKLYPQILFSDYIHCDVCEKYQVCFDGESLLSGRFWLWWIWYSLMVGPVANLLCHINQQKVWMHCAWWWIQRKRQRQRQKQTQTQRPVANLFCQINKQKVWQYSGWWEIWLADGKSRVFVVVFFLLHYCYYCPCLLYCRLVDCLLGGCCRWQ